MSTGHSAYFSGLAFTKPRDIDLASCARFAAYALETLDLRVLRIQALSESELRLVTHHYGLRIKLLRDQRLAHLSHPVATLVSIQIMGRPDTTGTAQVLKSDVVLARILRALQAALSADHVKLTGQPVLFAGEDFMELTEMLADVIPDDPAAMLRLSPQRAIMQHPADLAAKHSKAEAAKLGTPDHQTAVFQTLRPTESEEDDNGRDLEEETPLLRLSAWVMSIAVATLCLPLGAALTVINLIRGENLRLASQTAALTGTFVALESAGSVAQASTVLQNLLS